MTGRVGWVGSVKLRPSEYGVLCAMLNISLDGE